MIDRIEHEIGFQRAALNLRAYRQELLASNIANADTPHYKARDFDFKAALDNARAGSGAAAALARTSARHLAGAGSGPYGVEIGFRGEYQGAVDGNTVNMDIERAAFAGNALQMEAMLTFIGGKFKTLASAIQGQ